MLMKYNLIMSAPATLAVSHCNDHHHFRPHSDIRSQVSLFILIYLESYVLSCDKRIARASSASN